jgi:MoxR-like ATPase
MAGPVDRMNVAAEGERLMGEYRRMFLRADDPDAVAVRYPVTFGDRRPERPYVVSEDVELAVNVALATGRPLLVLGPPGSGKTSLGFAVAERLGWDVYDMVITSRTRAQDLLWSFDNVRRLSAALANREVQLLPDESFLEPGVLWWALDPERAAAVVRTRRDGRRTRFAESAVVVLDEIDKADPSVPNDLLRPLGDLQFEVTDLANERVQRTRALPPLVVITSNGERTLPTAFVRRCVVMELPGFDRDRLLQIAAAHFPDEDIATRFPSAGTEIRDQVLDELMKVVPKDLQGRPAIGTAEYLDVLRACLELRVMPGDRNWTLVSGTALVKQPAREG